MIHNINFIKLFTIIQYSQNFYDFGDCTEDSIVPTSSQFSTNSFEIVQHSFDSPGIYNLDFYTTNICTTVTFKDSITIFPPPIVDFTFDSVCFGDITSFFADVSFQEETLDTLDCGTIITVPQGSSNFTYLWNFGDGDSPETSTTDTTQNPVFEYENQGYIQ